MPVQILVARGIRVDCKEAMHLIQDIFAEALLADRGYDTDEIVAYVLDTGVNVIIPSKKSRKHLREYDTYL